MAGGLLLVLMLVGGAVWFVHNIVSGKENPPPPDKVEEPLPQDEPPPSPDNTPAPTPQLGLDAEGSAGGDSFGLAARQGGSDITGTGGAVFAWYTGKLKTAIAD